MTDKKDNIKLESTIEKKVIEIPKYQEHIFISLLKNIKRYCKYLKLPEPIVKELPDKTYFVIQKLVTFGKPYFVNNTMTDNYEEVKKYKDDHPKEKINIVSQDVSVKEIEIVNEVKPENDWEILGILDHEEGLIISAPNKQVPYDRVPKDLHDSSNCDHCHIKRFRNKTIFVENQDTGEIKCVGGTCIRYYLGYDYEKIMKIITELNLFNNYFDDAGGGWSDDDWFGGFGGKRYNPEDDIVDVKDIVKYFFYWVTSKGYMSKSAAERYNNKLEGDDREFKSRSSTSQIVNNKLYYLYVPPLNMRGKDGEISMANWQKDYDKYIKIINKADNKYFDVVKAFIEERYKENNFLLNSRNFFIGGGVKIKQMKYIISACSMYWGMKLSEDIKNQKTKELKKSDFKGTVGEKEKLENLTIKNISGFEGSFGWTNVYRLTDEKGNIYTKFGTINPRFLTKDSPVENIEVGAIVSFTAEIKKHDTWKEIKQTTLGRLSKI